MAKERARKRAPGEPWVSVVRRVRRGRTNETARGSKRDRATIYYVTAVLVCEDEEEGDEEEHSAEAFRIPARSELASLNCC